MKKSVTRTLYSDPGHGWLKVSLKELIDLGIETRISQYSYQKRDKYNKIWVYLEEDMDFSTYYEALKRKGITLKVKESVSDRPSRIRGYYDYDPEAVIALKASMGM